MRATLEVANDQISKGHSEVHVISPMLVRPEALRPGYLAFRLSKDQPQKVPPAWLAPDVWRNID